jgi:hypothetical protein
MKKMIVYLILFTIHFAYGANYLPVSVDHMLNEAEVVVEGIIIKDQITEKNSKLFWHEIYIEPILSIGLNEAERDKNHLLHLYYELNSYDQLRQHKASFKAGERVILIVNRVGNRLKLKHRAMAVFKAKSLGTRDLLISALIPMHPRYGQIDYQQFIDLAAAHLGGDIERYGHAEIEIKKNLADVQRSTYREPAMLQEATVNNVNTSNDLSGLIFILMLMCLAWRYTLVFNRK